MCTFNLCTDDNIINNKPLTIGKPCCNTKVYILDKSLKQVPVGVEGEIFIGGCEVGKRILKFREINK